MARSNPLRKAAQKLFDFASWLNTVGHLASGNPTQIAKHLIRKKVLKHGSKLLNK